MLTKHLATLESKSIIFSKDIRSRFFIEVGFFYVRWFVATNWSLKSLYIETKSATTLLADATAPSIYPPWCTLVSEPEKYNLLL